MSERRTFKRVTFITEKAACPAEAPPQTSKALIHVFKPVATQCIPYQLAPTASSTQLLLEFYTIYTVPGPRNQLGTHCDL
jgi:hypothetical protein